MERTINIRSNSDISSLLYIITQIFHDSVTNGIIELMSKITVSETVSRSIAVDNSIADVQTALVRCFQFLEERRFKEASVIIEQVLNIDPNNTDAHVANFLYQFELSGAEDVVNNFKSCATYENSVFYKRIKRSSPTELSKKLDFCLGRASEQLEKFNRRIEEEAQQKRSEKEKAVIRIIITSFILAIGTVIVLGLEYSLIIIVLTIVLVLVVAGRLL